MAVPKTPRESYLATRRQLRRGVLGAAGLILLGVAFDSWVWRVGAYGLIWLPILAWRLRRLNREIDALDENPLGLARFERERHAQSVREYQGAAAFCLLSALGYGYLALEGGALWIVLGSVSGVLTLLFELKANRLSAEQRDAHA